MKPKQDEYVFEKELHLPGGRARIYRPVLTEAERARRMQGIMNAAWDFVVATEKRKKESVYQ